MVDFMNNYKYLYFESISSTNTYLKENYNQLDEFTVAYTYHQTNGRGRLGRTWEGSKDNIAFSILLKPKKQDIAILSLLTGLAVSNAIDTYIKTLIKWPNDIIINDKKVCGILAESIISNQIDAYVVGIGININQTSFWIGNAQRDFRSVFVVKGNRVAGCACAFSFVA